LLELDKPASARIDRALLTMAALPEVINGAVRPQDRPVPADARVRRWRPPCREV
jgi:hypothetical protein